MTSHERSQRNLEVVEARARGLSWPRIARRHGVSDRQARRIVADFRASRPALHECDPVEIVEETLEALEAAIEDLSVLAGETDHDSTKLGAIKARVDIHHARIGLLQTIGVLPHNLGQVGVAIDLRQIAGRLVNVLEQGEIPEPVMQQVLEAIDPREVPRPPPPALLAVRQRNGSH